MPIRHITKLTADDFRAVIGQTFRVPFEEELRTWTLRDVEAKTLMLASQSRTCGEGEEPPAKPKPDKRTQAEMAKAAVAEINANLDAMGYTGPKVDGPVNTVTLGFEGETGNSVLPEGEYSLFHEGLGTIEGAKVTHTVRALEGPPSSVVTAPLYDVTFNVK